MVERRLGRPQALEPSTSASTSCTESKDASGAKARFYSRRIQQLVPSELAYDFFEARDRRGVEADGGSKKHELKDSKAIAGRLFAPLISKRQLTNCFLNAPFESGKVTIAFVYTIGLENDARSVPAGPANLVGVSWRARAPRFPRILLCAFAVGNFIIEIPNQTQHQPGECEVLGTDRACISPPNFATYTLTRLTRANKHACKIERRRRGCHQPPEYLRLFAITRRPPTKSIAV